MRNFPSEKTLVTIYWRKLARYNRARYKSRRRARVEGLPFGVSPRRPQRAVSSS
jgi:hypothetical protein